MSTHTIIGYGDGISTGWGDGISTDEGVRDQPVGGGTSNGGFTGA